MAVCDIRNVHEAVTTPRDIIRALIAAEAAASGVALAELLGPSRRRLVVSARYRAMRRIHDAYPDKSFPEIGRVFGRNHSTVMYALGRLKRAPRT